MLHPVSPTWRQLPGFSVEWRVWPLKHRCLWGVHPFAQHDSAGWAVTVGLEQNLKGKGRSFNAVFAPPKCEETNWFSGCAKRHQLPV